MEVVLPENGIVWVMGAWKEEGRGKKAWAKERLRQGLHQR